jgi:hypothetical protein
MFYFGQKVITGFCNVTVVNYYRMDEIRAELRALVAQQQEILNSPTVWKMSPEESDTYTQRNQRLRELCKELKITFEDPSAAALFPSVND